MNDSLSKDEYAALELIGGGSAKDKASACVSRNTKRLAGLKYIAWDKSSRLVLTDKGEQTLFLRSCIEGLRNLLVDPLYYLEDDVLTFLCKKGHVIPAEETNDGRPPGLIVTTKGRESLEDIDSSSRD